VPRRRHRITPAPPAPSVIGLRWASTDTDRSETDRPQNRCACCDFLQFHRELLCQLAALPLPENGLPHIGENGKALTTISLYVYRPTEPAR
jgi:hypothetical protein